MPGLGSGSARPRSARGASHHNRHGVLRQRQVWKCSRSRHHSCGESQARYSVESLAEAVIICRATGRSPPRSSWCVAVPRQVCFPSPPALAHLSARYPPQEMLRFDVAKCSPLALLGVGTARHAACRLYTVPLFAEPVCRSATVPKVEEVHEKNDRFTVRPMPVNAKRARAA